MSAKSEAAAEVASVAEVSTMMQASGPDDAELRETPSVGMADQIGFRLRFAQAAIWRDLLQTFRPFGVRPQHYAAMAIISASPGLTQQDLSAAMGVRGPNLVTLLDGLVKMKLVERRQRLDDRRYNGIHLSAYGEGFLIELNKAQANHEARLANFMTTGEQHELVRLLKLIEKASSCITVFD